MLALETRRDWNNDGAQPEVGGWKRAERRKIETLRLESGEGGMWHCGAELKQSHSPGQVKKTQPLLTFPKTVFLLHTPPHIHTGTAVTHTELESQHEGWTHLACSDP